jgi:DNA-binding transcriptional ArsR family regulator
MKRVLVLDENGSRLLYDPFNLKILRILIQTEMSATELSRKLGIPTVNAWRRLEKMRKLGLVELRRVVKVGNLEKRFYGASALRYIPVEILNTIPSDPDLKNAYLLFLEIQSKLFERQNTVDLDARKNLLDYYIYSDLLGFVETMELEETRQKLKRIKFYLEEFSKKL